MSIPEFSCAQCRERLPWYVAGTLPADEREAVTQHVQSCAACAEIAATWRTVDQNVQRRLDAVQPTVSAAALRQRVRERKFEREHMNHTDLREMPMPDTSPASPPTIPQIVLAPVRAPRRWLSGVAALAAVVLIALLTQAIFAGHHLAQPGTNPKPTQHPISGMSQVVNDRLYGVSMVSANEGWAVGQHELWGIQGKQTTTLQSQVLLDHYLNGTWTPSRMDINNDDLPALNGISMLSTTDGWAVGQTGALPLIMHYDGTAWHQVPVDPAYSGELQTVQMVSRDDGWAVGNQPGGLLHYDGHSWKLVPDIKPDQNLFLRGLSMISTNEGWAAGYIALPAPQGQLQQTNGIILHYHNGRWSEEKSAPNAELYSISIALPGEGWASGVSYTPDPTDPKVGDSTPFLLHYHNGQWTQAPNPLDASTSFALTFISIHMLSPTDGWLSGPRAVTVGMNDAASTNVLLHYNGFSWQQVPSPAIPNRESAGLLGFSFTPDGQGWAVGYGQWPASAGVPYGTGYSPQITPLIMHFSNGQWTVQDGG